MSDHPLPDTIDDTLDFEALFEDWRNGYPSQRIEVVSPNEIANDFRKILELASVDSINELKSLNEFDCIQGITLWIDSLKGISHPLLYASLCNLYAQLSKVPFPTDSMRYTQALGISFEDPDIQELFKLLSKTKETLAHNFALDIQESGDLDELMKRTRITSFHDRNAQILVYSLFEFQFDNGVKFLGNLLTKAEANRNAIKTPPYEFLYQILDAALSVKRSAYIEPSSSVPNHESYRDFSTVVQYLLRMILRPRLQVAEKLLEHYYLPNFDSNPNNALILTLYLERLGRNTPISYFELLSQVYGFEITGLNDKIVTDLIPHIEL